MSVDPTRWPDERNARVQAIFGAALDVPTEQRSAFVEQHSDGDAAMQAEVHELLRSLDEAGAFLAEPDSRPSHEQPGERIGRYKLLQRLGEGGFGVVWMAEQSEPIRRRVALKVIKLGMDTGQVVARFEAERQALALMDHPHIAKVLDGGATDAGRPYFVMELVRGKPIVAYCDTENLSTERRIELFCQVCHAVQHAHTKGVIHRDLKPNNILVAVHDGEPAPKIIDFGIAKATHQELTQRTLFTEFRQLIGTPEYMAPEQVDQSALDIDTRADVYSLGVTLYELLTGTKPFDSDTLREAGYAEMMRFIREVDPPKPSTRLRAMGEAVERVAQRRGVPADTLGSALRGDLDWIVMRALEKDRNRRYQTPTALAADLRRHLEQLPVEACPPSAAYRFSKFVRRNRGAVAAVAAVLLALAAGVVGTTIMLRRALDAEAAARTDATRATTILEFTQDMLSAANPYGSDSNYTLRQTLDDFHRGLGDRLAGQPEVEVEVRSTLGRAYLALGVFDRAAEHIDRVVALREAEAEAEAGGDGERLVDALTLQAELLRQRGDYADAEQVLDRAEQLERAGANRPERIAQLLVDRAVGCSITGRYRDAERMANEALALVEGAARAPALDTLAEVYRMEGRLEESLAKRQQALEMERQDHDLDHPSTVLARSRVAQTLGQLGRHQEAESLLRESLTQLRRSHESHPHVAETLINLAAHLRNQGKAEQALAFDDEAVAMCRKVYGPDHQVLGKAHGNRGSTLQRLGRFDEAEAEQKEALRILRLDLGPEHPDVATTLNNIAIVVSRDGRNDEALQLYEQALRIRRAAFEDPHPAIIQVLLNIAYTHMGTGAHGAAETRMREAIEQQTALHGARHPAVAASRIRLGALLRRMERPEHALVEARAGLEILAATAPDSPLHLTGNRVIGFACSTLGRYADAEPHLQQYLARARKQNLTARALDHLADFYRKWHAADPDAGHDAKAQTFAEERAALETVDPGR